MPNEIDLSATQIEQLDEALGQLARGASVAEVLAQADPAAVWLRPLLVAAAEVKVLPPPHPLPPPDASLQRMLAHAEKLRTTPPVTARPTPAASPASPGLGARMMALFAPALRGGFHVAALAASILIAFLAGTLLGSGTIYAAQQSLPGDPGYGLKRAIEEVQLGLTFNPARREYLQGEFNDRRRFETELLLDQGREAEIVLEDNLQVVGDERVVMGLAINITDSTEIEGVLTPGARVRLEAITATDGQVIAVKIVVIQPGTPAVSPTATASPSHTATASPTATAPAQTGDTISLPPTPTPSPSPTPDFVDPLDDTGNSTVDDNSGSSNDRDDDTRNANDSENDNDADFDDSNDNGVDAPPDNDNNTSDDSSDDGLNDNDDSDFVDDGSNDNNGSDDDFNDNSGDDFADDGSDNGDDDLSDDDFADDEFEDDSSNDNNDDPASDDSSGNDNSDDNADDDNSGSGSSNSGSGSDDPDDSDDADNDD